MHDFEQLPHTADIKIRVYGKTLHELFRNALIGMFQSIRPINKTCTYNHDRLVCPSLPQHRNITLQAPNVNYLLIDFLCEAWYLSDIYNEAYLDVTIQDISQTSISAILHGIEVEGFELVEIKAVTYHDLNIKHIGEQWQVDITFDI